jgi:hypothetical protein
VIFVRVGLVMCWCGNMTPTELFGCIASSVIGGISATINCQNDRLGARSAKMA